MSGAPRSRRAWGWHPLVDEWAARVVADAEVRPGQLVLDLGAGTGALTAHLVAAGARVLAVELHPERVRRLLAPGSLLVGADLVLQRAVVHRYAEGTASGAGRWLRGWDLRMGRRLPRRAFRSPPRVDSAVLVIRRR